MEGGLTLLGMSSILEVPADLIHKAQQEQEREHDSPNLQLETKRKKKLAVDGSYHYDQVGVAVKTPAMEQAEEFRLSLPVDNPSFLKLMVLSNVTTGFWLHLPMPFCKTYMPRQNSTVSLEDEEGEEYSVSYIVDKTALSAGWKKFANAQKLIEGDVAVFQLVMPLVFKVYVIKADYSKQDGKSFIAASVNQRNPENFPENGVVTKKKAEDMLPESTQSKCLTYFNVNSELAAQSATDTAGLDATERNGLPGSNQVVEKANDDDDFSILVDGVSINKELSRYHRAIYHELCCSQDMILHDNLLKTISCSLAAEMISEMVNITEAIGACNASTPKEDYVVWDRTLQGFELLGLKVGFLRARLGNLTNLNSELDKYGDSISRRDSLKEETEVVRGRIRKLRKLMKRLDNKIELMRADAQKHEKAFQEAASAPW